MGASSKPSSCLLTNLGRDPEGPHFHSHWMSSVAVTTERRACLTRQPSSWAQAHRPHALQHQPGQSGPDHLGGVQSFSYVSVAP